MTPISRADVSESKNKSSHQNPLKSAGPSRETDSFRVECFLSLTVCLTSTNWHDDVASTVPRVLLVETLS